MRELEQTLDSREVAGMIEKEHKLLMRDIRRYIKQIIEGNEKYFIECKLAPNDFFRESEYKDSIGRTLPCYRITKKGCEFIAHKLTGTKGTVFTARYINKFHSMENALAEGAGMDQIAQLRAAVEAQGRMLKGISSQLSLGTAMVGIGGRSIKDRYRSEIVRMVGLLQNEEALCKIYTFAKYVPQ